MGDRPIDAIRLVLDRVVENFGRISEKDQCAADSGSRRMGGTHRGRCGAGLKWRSRWVVGQSWRSLISFSESAVV